MKSIWGTIGARLDSPHYGRIIDELGHLDQLAATHPAEVMALLEGLRARLDSDDATVIQARRPRLSQDEKATVARDADPWAEVEGARRLALRFPAGHG